MADYDPEILHKFANRLYSGANTIIAVYTILGALIGAMAGYAFMVWLSGGGGSILVGLVLVGIAGFAAGSEKAFELKLRAQMVLALAQIEKNTKRQPA